MLESKTWFMVPGAIALGSLYGVLQPLPDASQPPRVPAATAAAACFGLLSLCLLSLFWIDASSPKTMGLLVVLAVALLGVLGFSMYRIRHHVRQADCPPQTNDFAFTMAGGMDFSDFEVGSIVFLIILCIVGIAGELPFMIMLWLAANTIGLACAAGGHYTCVPHAVQQ